MAVTPETLARYEYVYMAKIAEQAERYEDMVTFMNKVVCTFTIELTAEERNLLAVAYKNVIGPLRAAWIIMSSKDDHVEHRKRYKSEVEKEINKVCGEVLKLIEEHLIPSASDSESKVFYLKMKGDYYRYMAEFKVGDERKAAADDTMLAYKAAEEIAIADLKASHPIRLGLALNFSVFYYEILKASGKANSMAREAFEEAIDEMNTSGKKSNKDSAIIMQLLKENFTRWTSEMEKDNYYD